MFDKKVCKIDERFVLDVNIQFGLNGLWNLEQHMINPIVLSKLLSCLNSTTLKYLIWMVKKTVWGLYPIYFFYNFDQSLQNLILHFRMYLIHKIGFDINNNLGISLIRCLRVIGRINEKPSKFWIMI